jgi:phosphoglycerol transferase MdoB-like AlkP superfamily enzyme
MEDMEKVHTAVYTSVALVVLFLIFSTQVMPLFNQTYNFGVTGLSSTMNAGIWTLVFVLAVIGMAVLFLPKFAKKE